MLLVKGTHDVHARDSHFLQRAILDYPHQELISAAKQRSVNLMVLTIIEFLHAHISKFGLTQLTHSC